MDSSINLLEPYAQSSAFDDVEKAMQSVFMTAFHELYGETVQDIHYFGMPHLGSPKVVERFTKQDGLAVLRRPSSSDETMRVIYSNWRSLASKRGLAFLEFVLQMLWADQWKIHRLYHSIERLDGYPTLAMTAKTQNSFLTSRVMITLDSEVSVNELIDLAPTLNKLVPANIVPKISYGAEIEETDEIKIYAGFIPYAVSYFQLFDYDYLEADWGEWILSKTFTYDGVNATFHAFKTNLKSFYEGVAIRNIYDLVISLLDHPDYSEMLGVIDAMDFVSKDYGGYKVDADNQRLVCVGLPDDLDYLKSSTIMFDRVKAYSNGGTWDFIGADLMMTICDYLEWTKNGADIEKTVPAPINQTSSQRYIVGAIVDYVSFDECATKYIDNLVATSPSWSGATLLERTILSSTELAVEYKQLYEVDSVQSEEIFTVNKEINPEFVSEDATIFVVVEQDELTNAFMLTREKALLESKDLIVEYIDLAVESAYQIDSLDVNNDLYAENIVYIPFSTVADQIFIHHSDDSLFWFEGAEEFLNKILMTTHNPNQADQLIPYLSLLSDFESSKVFIE